MQPDVLSIRACNTSETLDVRYNLSEGYKYSEFGVVIILLLIGQLNS